MHVVGVHGAEQVRGPARLMSKYSRGIRMDSPTAFLAAKWITASIGWLANTRPSA